MGDPQVTKDRILDAAEALFAARGVEGASLRAVTRAAGVNLAAIHYHYGSKEALLEAVIARRVGPINQARLKRLEMLEGAAQGAPLVLEDLLGAFIEPALRSVAEQGGALLPKLISRLYWEAGDAFRPMVIEQFREVATRFGAALVRTLAPMPPVEVFVRFQYAIGVMIHELSERAHDHPNELFPAVRESHAARLARLTVFIAAGLRAPLASEGEVDD